MSWGNGRDMFLNGCLTGTAFGAMSVCHKAIGMAGGTDDETHQDQSAFGF